MSFRSPLDIWVENPTFLCAEAVFIFWGLLTLRHGMLCSLVPSMHKRLGTRLVQQLFNLILHDSKTSLPALLPHTCTTVDASPYPSHIFSYTNLPGSISRSGYFSFIYLFIFTPSSPPYTHTHTHTHTSSHSFLVPSQHIHFVHILYNL